jgi:hypothetical protein
MSKCHYDGEQARHNARMLMGEYPHYHGVNITFIVSFCVKCHFCIMLSHAILRVFPHNEWGMLRIR